MNDLNMYDHTADGAVGYIILSPALGTCLSVGVGNIPAGKIVKVYTQLGSAWVPYPGPATSTMAAPSGSVVLRGPARYMVDFRDIPSTEDIGLSVRTIDVTVGDTPFGQEAHSVEHGVFDTLAPPASGSSPAQDSACCAAASTDLIDGDSGNPVFVTYENGAATYHTLASAGAVVAVPEASLRAKPTQSELRFYLELTDASLTVGKIIDIALASTSLPAGARLKAMDMWVLPIAHASDAGNPNVLGYVAYGGPAHATYHHVDERLVIADNAGAIATLDPITAGRGVKVPNGVVARFTIVVSVDIPAP